MTAALQSADVVAFWDFMTQHYGTTVVNKQDAVEMKVIAAFLSALGIVDSDSFLKQYTTTIGRRIYIPFTIGDASTLDLWDQITICIHEHQHVVQHDKLGIRFELTYIASKADRARYEAEAYRSALEVAAWRGLPPPDPNQLALELAGYGVGPDNQAMAAKLFELWEVPVKLGAVLTESSQVGLAWMNEHIPQLKRKG